jgi:phage terminase large subunit-like protein
MRRQVIAGKISACLYARQACERQLRDLDRTDWPYQFESRSSRHAFAGSLNFFRTSKGSKRRRADPPSPPWQAFILTTAFGWVRRDTGPTTLSAGYIEVAAG